MRSHRHYLAGPLLGAALLLSSAAVAQTAPAAKPAVPAAARPAAKPAKNTNVAPPADPARSSEQSGYAAPGEPLVPPSNNGKRPPRYDGQPAKKPTNANTTLPTPK